MTFKIGDEVDILTGDYQGRWGTITLLSPESRSALVQIEAGVCSNEHWENLVGRCFLGGTFREEDGSERRVVVPTLNRGDSVKVLRGHYAGQVLRVESILDAGKAVRLEDFLEGATVTLVASDVEKVATPSREETIKALASGSSEPPPTRHEAIVALAYLNGVIDALTLREKDSVLYNYLTDQLRVIQTYGEKTN